jgi:hypothetical protein
LWEARVNIRQSYPDGQRRLGILFARPYFGKKVEPKTMNEHIQLWVDNLAALETSSYAWVFPQCVRNMRGSDGNYYPGEAILIKEIIRK